MFSLSLRWLAPTSARKASSASSHLLGYERGIALTPSQIFSKELVPSAHRQQQLTGEGEHQQQLHPPRRWSRDPHELCVDTLNKSPSLLTSYEISYKFSDPQWYPMLNLPCGNPVSMELRARHINFALKHLVQKGHAFYVVRRTHHSVLHPRGLAVVSHVVCSLEQKNERLLTSIIHEGPVDASDPNGKWGVVATSDAWGLARSYQRREMLFQRSRRIGSIQAQMGSFDWTQLEPEDVGRSKAEEVMLLKKDSTFVGQGFTSRGIVTSTNVAKHPFHYVNQFEAPATCGVDVFHQAMYHSARHHQLVLPGEQLHVVASTVRQFFPYAPIELDLPFQVICGPPMVFRGDDLRLVPPPALGAPYLTAGRNNNNNDSSKKKTSSSSSKKMRKKDSSNASNDGGGGICLIQYDVTFKQGASEYLYDQGKVHRAPKFWSQRNTLPYECTFWCMRDGHVDSAHVEEIHPTFERMRGRLHTSSSSSVGDQEDGKNDDDDDEVSTDDDDDEGEAGDADIMAKYQGQDLDELEERDLLQAASSVRRSQKNQLVKQQDDEIDDKNNKYVQEGEAVAATGLFGVIDYRKTLGHTDPNDKTSQAAMMLHRLADRRKFWREEEKEDDANGEDDDDIIDEEQRSKLVVDRGERRGGPAAAAAGVNKKNRKHQKTRSSSSSGNKNAKRSILPSWDEPSAKAHARKRKAESAMKRIAAEKANKKKSNTSSKK